LKEGLDISIIGFGISLLNKGFGLIYELEIA